MRTNHGIVSGVLLAVTTCVLATSTGCTTAEDRGYSREVRAVLRQASELEWKFAMSGIADSLSFLADDIPSTEKPVQAIDTLEKALEVLPTPRSRGLRYLHMRLLHLAASARALQYSHNWYAKYVMLSRQQYGEHWQHSVTEWNNKTQESYIELRDSVALLTAAERVCLGTSMLRDMVRARALGPGTEAGRSLRKLQDARNERVLSISSALASAYKLQEAQGSDSALAAHEKFVRLEISKVR